MSDDTEVAIQFCPGTSTTLTDSPPEEMPLSRPAGFVIA